MIDNNYNNIDITYMSIEDIKNITDKLITAPNINALVATPQISSIAGYWNSGASYGQIIVLWKNTLARGWVKIEAGNQTGMVVLGHIQDVMNPDCLLDILKHLASHHLLITHLQGLGIAQSGQLKIVRLLRAQVHQYKRQILMIPCMHMFLAALELQEVYQ